MLRKTALAAVVAGAFAVIVTGPGAVATHEPADKAAATASSIDELNDSKVLLEEKMRVSSTSDLILQTTAECSILTALRNPGSEEAGDTDTQGSFGQVELWITIDGRRVPVSNSAPADSDPETEEGTDNGEVVFCNRAYAREITDKEDPLDGYDEEDDFIRTRTANGFNWMAFNVGKEYDADANNVVTVQLHGRFTRENTNGDASCGDAQPDNALVPYNMTCSDAFVGSRSLIIEPTHASTHEAAAPVDDGADDTDGTSIGGVSLP